MSHGAEDDKSRFETVFRATRVPILGYLLRRVSRPADAADLLGEVYVIAWRRVADLPEGEGARLWLYAVARQVLANHYRSESHQAQLGERLRQQLLIESDHFQRSQPSDQLAAHLDRLLDQLNSEDRELIRLSIWEGLSAADIAQVTGRTGGAVRVRLHRIRKNLANQMQSADDDTEQHRRALMSTHPTA